MEIKEAKINPESVVIKGDASTIDDIDEIKISCSCGRKAIINARVNDDGYVITDGEQILIGGNDRYIPLCRKCYSDAIKFNLKVKEK